MSFLCRHKARDGLDCALFVETLGVSGIKSISLASIDELLLCEDLVWVFAAPCMGDSKLVIVDIENEIMLAHHSSSKSDVTRLRDIQCHTVPGRLIPVQILAWEPVHVVCRGVCLIL